MKVQDIQDNVSFIRVHISSPLSPIDIEPYFANNELFRLLQKIFEFKTGKCSPLLNEQLKIYQAKSM